MKRNALVMLVFISATNLHAQYIPPARDLDEATKMIQEVGRALQPAMIAVRDESDVLGVLALAHRKLQEHENQPATAVDEALKPIDEYLEKRKTLELALSREMQDYLRRSREMIASANTPPNSLGDARERLHHKFIHPMQMRVVRNAQKLADFEQSYRSLVDRVLRPVQMDALSRVSSASVEVK